MRGGLQTRFTAMSADHARQIKRQIADSRLEAFAEALSELNTIRAASAYVGVSERTGERYMAKLAAEAGRQAL